MDQVSAASVCPGQASRGRGSSDRGQGCGGAGQPHCPLRGWGEPLPEVSLAVNGIILHTERVLLLSTLIHNVTMDMETVSCLLHCGQWVRQTSRVCQAGHCEMRAGHLSAEYDPGQGGSEAGDPV